tara:strand:+ start:286 stop:582 length:297 start_codon:yes stop_codon:yes gene_type:complete
MNDSVTMQDLVQLENDYLNQIREINTTHRYDVEGLELKLFKAEHDNVTKDVLLMNAEYEIANLRDRLESIDRQWNKTIDELERLKHMPEVHKAIYGIK